MAGNDRKKKLLKLTELQVETPQVILGDFCWILVSAFVHESSIVSHSFHLLCFLTLEWLLSCIILHSSLKELTIMNPRKTIFA